MRSVSLFHAKKSLTKVADLIKAIQLHTFGRKALLIRNILSTLILKLKLQSFSAMLKIDPLATYLDVVGIGTI